jgi:putative membrane protein
MRAFTHPVIVVILNGGGLWIIHTTDLYRVMSEHPSAQMAVHVHIVTAGYLFTAGIIGVDPAHIGRVHRPGPSP